MKKLIFILLGIIFASCNHSNPVSPIISASDNFFGLPNTTREYERTTFMFQPDTNIPYIKVPDSLYKKLSFDTSQINQGLVDIYIYQEVVISPDTTFAIPSHSDFSINYYQIKTFDEEHEDLEDDLEFAKQGKTFPGISLGTSIDGTFWIENKKELYTQNNIDTANYIYLQKPLKIGAEWVRETNKYKNADGTYGTFQLECKVVTMQEVSVKAGNFLAYKIEVTNDWVDIGYKSIRDYEYYVPNVGLILMESDMNVYSTTLGSGTTLYFRQVIRQELISYNFVK